MDLGVTMLTKDLKDMARRIEKTFYGKPEQAARSAGRRSSARFEVIYEHEETEQEEQRWMGYASAAAAGAVGQ